MPDPEPTPSWGDGLSRDEALSRLEDTLLAYPYDRALPDLATILAESGVTEHLLRTDERALKVLHEAIVARPLHSAETVGTLKTEVELLTLEVEVLAERLRDRGTGTDAAGRAAVRLEEVRRRLAQLQSQL